MTEMEIKITPADEPRQGWDEKFAEMHRNGDDELVIEDVFEDDCFDIVQMKREN